MSAPCSCWISPHSLLVLLVPPSLTCTPQATCSCVFSEAFRKETTSPSLHRLLLTWCSSQGKGNVSKQPSLLVQWCWFNVLLLHNNLQTGNEIHRLVNTGDHLNKKKKKSECSHHLSNHISHTPCYCGPNLNCLGTEVMQNKTSFYQIKCI